VIHKFQGGFTVMTRLPQEIMIAKDAPDGLTEDWVTVSNKDFRMGQNRPAFDAARPNRNLCHKNCITLTATQLYPLSGILGDIDTNTFSAMLTTDDHETLDGLWQGNSRTVI
jgi:hypothetical protein